MKKQPLHSYCAGITAAQERQATQVWRLSSWHLSWLPFSLLSSPLFWHLSSLGPIPQVFTFIVPIEWLYQCRITLYQAWPFDSWSRLYHGVQILDIWSAFFTLALLRSSFRQGRRVCGTIGAYLSQLKPGFLPHCHRKSQIWRKLVHTCWTFQREDPCSQWLRLPKDSSNAYRRPRAKLCQQWFLRKRNQCLKHGWCLIRNYIARGWQQSAKSCNPWAACPQLCCLPRSRSRYKICECTRLCRNPILFGRYIIDSDKVAVFVEKVAFCVIIGVLSSFFQLYSRGDSFLSNLSEMPANHSNIMAMLGG